MGVKSPKLSPDYNSGQLNIFECLFIDIKGMMLLPPHETPLLPYFSTFKKSLNAMFFCFF